MDLSDVWAADFPEPMIGFGGCRSVVPHGFPALNASRADDADPYGSNRRYRRLADESWSEVSWLAA